MCQPLLYSAIAADAGARRPLAQALQLVQRLLHLRFDTDDADEVLHHVLQIALHGVRVFRRRPALEGRQRRSRRPFHGVLVDPTGGVLLREFCRELAGALTEDQQIRQRVAAEPVRAVQARRGFAGRKEARQRRHLRVAVDADSAHRVVRRRPHFHRRRRDVEVGELLELVVHARQLLPDVLGRRGQLGRRDCARRGARPPRVGGRTRHGPRTVPHRQTACDCHPDAPHAAADVPPHPASPTRLAGPCGRRCCMAAARWCGPSPISSPGPASNASRV